MKSKDNMAVTLIMVMLATAFITMLITATIINQQNDVDIINPLNINTPTPLITDIISPTDIGTPTASPSGVLRMEVE